MSFTSNVRGNISIVFLLFFEKLTFKGTYQQNDFLLFYLFNFVFYLGEGVKTHFC